MNNQLTFMRQDFGSASFLTLMRLGYGPPGDGGYGPSYDTVKIPIKNEILPL